MKRNCRDDGCCCIFDDDGETQLEWCFIHAAMRDRIREQLNLLDECKRALEAIIDFRASRTFSGNIVGIDEQYPDVVIAMKHLAKLRKEQADE